jgi:hypothetical protein
MTIQQVEKLQERFLAAFIAELEVCGGTKLRPGQKKMPREQWARCMAFASCSVGFLKAEDIEVAMACFNSEAGNASQLGASFIRKGVIELETVDSTANDFAARAKAMIEAAEKAKAEALAKEASK